MKKTLNQNQIDTLAGQILNSQLNNMDQRREFIIDKFEGSEINNPLKAFVLRITNYRTHCDYLVNQFELPEIIFKKTDDEIKAKANSSSEYRNEYEKASSEPERKMIMSKYNILFAKEVAKYVLEQYKLLVERCNSELDEKIILDDRDNESENAKYGNGFKLKLIPIYILLSMSGEYYTDILHKYFKFSSVRTCRAFKNKFKLRYGIVENIFDGS